VCVDELELLHDIERLLRVPIPREFIPGFEPDSAIRAEPIRELVRGGRVRSAPSRGPAHRATPTHAATSRRGPQRRRDRPGIGAPAAHPRTAGSHSPGPRDAAPRSGGPRNFVTLPGERFARSTEGH
jgi:ATP-dependent RNA helicase RhlE